MSSADQSNIHRHLDDAFSGVAMTPELQDLKEEIRSNLAARVSELLGQGTPPDAAAATAIAELGDLSEIIGQESGDGVPQSATGYNTDPRTPAATATSNQLAAYALNKVKPNAGFVIGIVILGVIALASLLLFALALGSGGETGMTVLSGFALAVCAGGITAWSLRQETSHNYPVPQRRALGYGASGGAAVVGVALCAMVATAGTGMLAAGIFVVLGASVGFIKLGLSQTNRKKPWVRAAQRDYQFQDRFSQDPVAAARFGILTAVIWITAFAIFAWLSFAVGLGLSWLALLAGLAVFMLVLARMLFPAEEAKTRKAREK